METDMEVDEYLNNYELVHVPFQSYSGKKKLFSFQPQSDPKQLFLNSKGKLDDENDYEIWEAQTSTSFKKPYENYDYLTDLTQFEKLDDTDTCQKDKNMALVPFENEEDANTPKKGEIDIYDSRNYEPMSQQEIEELAKLSIYYNPACHACERFPTLVEAYLTLVFRTFYQILIISVIV